MYKHDGLLYYQAGHYGTEKACLHVTSLVSVTHVHERGGLLRRDFIYIQVHASASPAGPSPSVLSATSLSPCEMVGSTTSAEACYAEISSTFKSMQVQVLRSRARLCCLRLRCLLAVYCEMVGSTTSAEACYAEITCENVRATYE
jgi:hypothetical protein